MRTCRQIFGGFAHSGKGGRDGQHFCNEVGLASGLQAVHQRPECFAAFRQLGAVVGKGLGQHFGGVGCTLCAGVVGVVIGRGGLHHGLQAAEGLGHLAGGVTTGEAHALQRPAQGVADLVDGGQAGGQAGQRLRCRFAGARKFGGAQHHRGHFVAHGGELFGELLRDLLFAQALGADLDAAGVGVEGAGAEAQRVGHGGAGALQGAVLAGKRGLQVAIHGAGFGFVAAEPATFVEFEVLALEALLATEFALESAVFELAAKRAVDQSANGPANGPADRATQNAADDGARVYRRVAAAADGAVAATDSAANAHTGHGAPGVAAHSAQQVGVAHDVAAQLVQKTGGVVDQPVASAVSGKGEAVTEAAENLGRVQGFGEVEHVAHAHATTRLPSHGVAAKHTGHGPAHRRQDGPQHEGAEQVF